MEEKNNLDILPNRIKYYLIKWQESHYSDYKKLFGKITLDNLTFGQLHNLFIYATARDGILLDKLK